MAKIQVNLRNLQLLNGSTITDEKITIVDNNMQTIDGVLKQMVETPVMDTVIKTATPSASTTDAEIVEVFNNLIGELKAKGFMKRS